MFSPSSTAAWALALTAPLALADTPPPSPLQEQLAEPGLSCVTPVLELSVKDREWLEPFYLLRGSQAAWNKENLPVLFAQLEALADDGLEPRAYHLEPLRQLAEVDDPSPRLAACVDVLATTAYLRALRDLSYGRLE